MNTCAQGDSYVLNLIVRETIVKLDKNVVYWLDSQTKLIFMKLSQLASRN